MVFRSSKIIFVLAVLVSGIWPYGCGRSASSTSSEYAAALLAHPQAKDVEFSKHEGTDQLTYRLEEKFPASSIIGWTSLKLKEMEWEPLTYDYLNPNLPSSHINGWAEFIDGTGPTEQIVHQWLADWKDRSENIVRYAFHYRYPKGGGPNLTKLEVSAVYIPAPLAKESLEAAQKFREKNKPKN